MKARTVRLLTAKELAAALQLKAKTLYRLASNGAIPFVRIGKKAIRFDRERVRKALASAARSFKRSRWPFVRLDDLEAPGEWLKPPADLLLKRFKVPFPTKDLAGLASAWAATSSRKTERISSDQANTLSSHTERVPSPLRGKRTKMGRSGRGSQD